MLEFRHYFDKYDYKTQSLGNYEVLITLTRDEAERFKQFWDNFDFKHCFNKGYVYLTSFQLEHFNECLQKFYKKEFEGAIDYVITDAK